jgi:hypothetical protein
VITTTAPNEIHMLDYAANHGDDHPGHTIAAGFALWAIARTSYRGPVIAHRGYNVENEPVNLSDADYAQAQPMLAYFDPCYFKYGTCGQTGRLDRTHDIWIHRQYAMTSDVGTAAGAVESQDTPGSCLSVLGDGSLGLAACGGPGQVRLDHGHLIAGTACVASGPANSDPLALAACADDPAQFWLLDSEGGVWNGRPPGSTPTMYFDHTRCLAPAAAPVCGSQLRPRWRLIP